MDLLGFRLYFRGPDYKCRRGPRSPQYHKRDCMRLLGALFSLAVDYALVKTAVFQRTEYQIVYLLGPASWHLLLCNATRVRLSASESLPAPNFAGAMALDIKNMTWSLLPPTSKTATRAVSDAMQKPH